MRLFVDASALIAVIANEIERSQFGMAIRDADERLWSAMTCWEAIAGLTSSYKLRVADARREVELVASRLPFRLVSIGEEERLIALDAYERYGRSSGHPAKLNMGDCFAYACAKTSGARLLYKGDDFIHTDLA